MNRVKQSVHTLLVFSSYWSFRAVQAVLAPLVEIRIDIVRAGRIGHIVSECEQVLIEPSDSRSSRRRIDFVVFPPGNTYLVEFYAARFRKRPSTIVVIPRDVRFSLLAYAGAEVRRRYFAGDLSKRWYCGPLEDGGQFHIRKPLPPQPVFNVSPGEIADALVTLATTGFATERPIVCLHVRDNAYLPAMRYHDYRDPPLENYTPLIKYLIDQGYSVVRTGSVANARVPITDPAFLDYPFCPVRSDTMDVMLYACCALAIAGGMSGLSSLAIVMRKPLVICDVRPLFVNTYSPEVSRFIFSRMRWTDTGEQLSLAEMLDLNASETSVFAASGAEFIPNTADEIVTVTQELLDQLAGKQPEPAASNASSETFWQFVRENGKYRHGAQISPEFMPGLGTSFLQANAYALGIQVEDEVDK